MTNKYFNFSLKPQQSKAFNELCEFVENDTYKAFVLKGYAGTGKTTLMSGFINKLKETDCFFSLLASTGRAAKILTDKTGIKAKTVHGEIYVFNDISDNLEELNTQKTNFTVDDSGQLSLLFDLRKIAKSETTIYIIDEASMISDSKQKGSFADFGSGKLLQDLLSFDKNGKFVFVGDPLQLPPINEKFSPALSKDYLQAQYNIKAKEIELTEIVRQATDNGIIKSSMKIRDLHKKNPKVKWAGFPLRGFNNINIHPSHISLLNTYIKTVQTKGVENATLICQTNRHCSDLNRNIRIGIGKTNQSIVVDDILMVTQNNYITGLTNGDIVRIKAIGAKEYRCGLSFINVKVEELVSKNSFSCLMIEDIVYSVYTNLDSKQNKDLMIDFSIRMNKKDIKQGTQDFKNQMLKDPYLNALKSVFGYALTCHKSQGGEWDDIFLYLDNKIHGIPKPAIYQWLYTAVTRAKVNLHIVNDWFVK